MRSRLMTMTPACIVGIAGAAAGQTGLGRIEVGKPFPAMELPALADGPRASVADFRGMPTVLIVFASW